jgi:hypothetical protein
LSSSSSLAAIIIIAAIVLLLFFSIFLRPQIPFISSDAVIIAASAIFVNAVNDTAVFAVIAVDEGMQTDLAQGLALELELFEEVFE